MVTSPLIRPYLLGGVALGGGTLGSHDNMEPEKKPLESWKLLHETSETHHHFLRFHVKFPRSTFYPNRLASETQENKDSMLTSKVSTIRCFRVEAGVIKWDSS